MSTVPRAQQQVPATVGLWDTVSIIVGIIIGGGIYQTSSDVFNEVSGPWQAMAVWAIGGVLSLIGALCFAELASTYPRSGGEYTYLTRAFGPGIGFLFAWSQLAVVRTGAGIAALAYVFATNANSLWTPNKDFVVGYAILAIAVLSLINIVGVKPGTRAQNLLTLTKVAALGGLIAAGFLFAQPHGPSVASAATHSGSFALAMIFVFYTYDGWNEAASITAEVTNRRRNLPRALLLGTSAVVVIYLLINAAYLMALGFEGARASKQLPADLFSLALGDFGGKAMHVLIIISTLGSINGTIFTGSRVYSELGADHRLFAPMGWWNSRFQTPACALAIQGIISIGMVVFVSLWWKNTNGFEQLVKFTSPVFWLFFLLASVSLFVLRFKDPEINRPFPVPVFPWLPLIFCCWCAYMLYGSVTYAREEAFTGLAILLVGVPLYWTSRWMGRTVGTSVD